MKYPLTFYVNKLSAGVAGRANGPVIRILEQYREDYGLYCHERLHVVQWFVVGILFAVPLLVLGLILNIWTICFFGFTAHSLLYWLSDNYRLRAEVAAYREQANHYDDYRLDRFAGFIATRYKLDITPEEALKLLRGE